MSNKINSTHIFLFLVLATILLWLTAEPTQASAMTMSLSLALVAISMSKVYLIMLYFMELKEVPLLCMAAFTAWVVVVTAMIMLISSGLIIIPI